MDDFDLPKIKKLAKTADLYVLDEEGLLYYIPAGRADEGEDRQGVRVVLPTTICEEVLRHFHCSLSGGHQGISKTYRRIAKQYYWRGMFADVQRFVQEFPDCERNTHGYEFCF